MGMSKSELSASPKHVWANNSLRFALQFDDSGGDSAGESLAVLDVDCGVRTIECGERIILFETGSNNSSDRYNV